MLLLLIIIYIAGVLFTDVALQHHAETGDGDHHHAMMRFFGSLGLSVQTLFRAISGEGGSGIKKKKTHIVTSY